MRHKIAHEILAPDDRTGLISLGVERKRRNETVQAYLARSAIRAPVPPICVINGVPVLRGEWATRRIRSRDRVRFCYRLAGGGNGRGVAVMSIVALLALSVLAPYAGAALATAAFGSATAAIGGVAYSTIFSGIALEGGAILLKKAPRE